MYMHKLPIPMKEILRARPGWILVGIELRWKCQHDCKSSSFNLASDCNK